MSVNIKCLETNSFVWELILWTVLLRAEKSVASTCFYRADVLMRQVYGNEMPLLTEINCNQSFVFFQRIVQKSEHGSQNDVHLDSKYVRELDRTWDPNSVTFHRRFLCQTTKFGGISPTFSRLTYSFTNKIGAILPLNWTPLLQQIRSHSTHEM